ncbi:MAG: hypothetical protein JSV34_01735 [Candidatus Omnitrophota bacterium]|nr:MAG: hypothetical protein JSV34_01735 [Candidatus Omnitrophota bacterium]
MNKKLIILIILSVAAVISLTYGILVPPKYGQKTAIKKAGIEKDELKEASFISLSRKAKKSGYAEWGQSPFSFDAGLSGQLILNGILWDSERPLVIINGVTLGVGGKINGNTVIDIQKDKVILNDGVSEFQLKLGEKK